MCDRDERECVRERELYNDFIQFPLKQCDQLCIRSDDIYNRYQQEKLLQYEILVTAPVSSGPTDACKKRDDNLLYNVY